MDSKIQKIAQQILDDAKEESESILDAARKSADALTEKQKQLALQKAKKESVARMKKAEREAEVIRGRVTIEIEQEAHWKVLSEKKNLTTAILEQAKKRLLKLQKSEGYASILEKLIVNAGVALSGGSLEVTLNEKDRSQPLNISALGEAITEKTGVETQLVVSNEVIKLLGVLVKTEDGRIVVDSTFEAIMKRRERELRFKIAKILFGNS